MDRVSRKNIFLKKLSKFLVRVKRSCTFAPANRKASKKRRHVPRHIELTAVLREILKQI